MHRLLIFCLLGGCAALAASAPYVPGADNQVLASVLARASDPRARELLALRAAWRAQPDDVGRAVRLAQHYFQEVAAEGDPRYVGYAQAALQPWWNLPAPPPAVRVLRAMVRQFDHRFALALADLDAAVQEEPDNGRAWAWRTAILLVQADYAEARRSCQQMAALTTPLIAAACLAQVDGSTGQATAAAARLASALQAHADAGADERLWALTRLAELQERRGAQPAAEAAYRQALAVGQPDVYLLAAYADFLLDNGRAADVLTLLQDNERADVLLLRLAIAARTVGDPRAARYSREMAARFDAAALRGDTTHRKEESRYVRAVLQDAPRALALAQENYAVQKEPADARILLEAALAARNPAAAQPVLDWMAASRIESVALQALAGQIRALK